MADLLYLGATLLFFGVSWIFITVCERLMEAKP